MLNLELYRHFFHHFVVETFAIVGNDSFWKTVIVYDVTVPSLHWCMTLSLSTLWNNQLLLKWIDVILNPSARSNLLHSKPHAWRGVEGTTGTWDIFEYNGYNLTPPLSHNITLMIFLTKASPLGCVPLNPLCASSNSFLLWGQATYRIIMLSRFIFV